MSGANQDFKALADRALAACPGLLRQWFPNGRQRGRKFFIGNVQGEKGDSLAILLDSGGWHDMASGDRGKDLIALYAARRGVSQIEAAKALADELGEEFGAAKPAQKAEPKPKDEWRPIMPVPKDAPKPVFSGRPEHIAQVRNQDGRLLHLILRYPPQGDRRKVIKPMTFGTFKGVTGWHDKAPASPRPLYGFPIQPDRPVLVVEGEMKRDAAARLLGDSHAVVSWPNGADGVSKADWKMLAGREVLVWPDADATGIEAAKSVVKALKGIAISVRAITPPDDKPAKWDLADAEREGWTGDDVRRHLSPEPMQAVEITDYSEDAVGLRFAGSHAGQLAFDHSQQIWYTWDGSRWDTDKTGVAFNKARDAIRAEAVALDEADRTRKSMGKLNFTRAVEAFAKADPRLAVHQGVWDSDPWVLSTPGGVVDLKTGLLRAARPDDWISRQTAVAPAAAAAHPFWTDFLRQATEEDADTQDFLQRLAGYCLTGDVTEEMLSFIYGGGGNGKGVFVSTITGIMADYSVAMPMDAFTAEAKMPAEYYRAQMAGARLITASETEAGRTWAESQIKELTGNEAPVSARHPYGRPFTYRPQFKLMFVGNHAPRLKGRSQAMERRLRVIPFENEPTRPDPDLKDKLKKEWPAILRWMIDGCLMWQRDRLGTAPAIAAKTADYFEQQDAFGRWMAERCTLDTTLSARPGALYAAFKAWCQGNGEHAPSNAEFSELIERTKGLKRVTIGGSRWIRGIALRSEEADSL